MLAIDMRDNSGGSLYVLQKLVALLIEPSIEALVDSHETWRSIHEFYLFSEFDRLIAKVIEDPELTVE